MFNQKMKKTLILTLFLALSLTSCKTKSDTDSASSEAPASTEAVSTDATATPEISEASEETLEKAGIQVKSPEKGDTVATITFKEFGDVKIKLFPDEAPKAVENFTTHAKEGYYDGLTMHRVIADFMI